MMWHMGMGWFGMFVQLLVIVAIVFLIVKLLKKESYHGTNYQNAETILKERFARGELTKEEYEEMLEILRK